MSQRGPKLEIKDLRLVSVIAKQGGVSRAATRLGLSQSAVSHHLARIEKRLGVELFTRAGRSMQCTEQGQQLAELAVELTGRLLEVEQALAQTQKVRRIRMCTHCYTAYHWLPGLLEAWQKLQPEVEIQIVLEATRASMEALAAHRVDVSLCHFEPPDSTQWIRRKLFDDRFEVIVAPNHPLAARKRLKPEHLADQTLLVYDLPTVDLRRFGREIFVEHQPAAVRRVPLTEAIIELVKAGQGVSLMSRWAMRPWVERGEIVSRPLVAPGVTRRWQAVYRKGGPKQAMVRQLVDLIRETRALDPRR